MFDSAEKQQLLEATEKNDSETVRSLLDRKNETSVTFIVERRKTLQNLAHVAAKNAHLDVLRIVVEKEPAVLLALDPNDDKVLDLAIRANAFDAVAYLVGQYESHGYFWTSALRTAIETGRLDIVKYFVDEKKVDVNAPDGGGQYQPPIFVAVKHNRTDIFEYLIEEKRANVTALDYNKENILFEAVRRNDLYRMKTLIERKKIDFDIDWKNWEGEALVHVAATLNRIRILRYLVLGKLADVNVRRKSDRKTPLHCAATENHYEICKFLVEKGGASTQIRDANGRTPMQEATDEQVVGYLRTFTPNRGRRSLILPFSANLVESEANLRPEDESSLTPASKQKRINNLRRYLGMASKQRDRPSQSLPLVFDSDHGNLRGALRCIGEKRSPDTTDVSHFQSFLMLVSLGMKNVMTKSGRKIENPTLVPSPVSILREKVDSSVAIDVVDGNINFS